MKFRKVIEIGENVIMHPPFLPRLQVGQHITVDGNPGRFVGVSKGGTVWIAWPKTGTMPINEKIKIMHSAFKEVRKNEERPR